MINIIDIYIVVAIILIFVLLFVIKHIVDDPIGIWKEDG